MILLAYAFERYYIVDNLF